MITIIKLWSKKFVMSLLLPIDGPRSLWWAYLGYLLTCYWNPWNVSHGFFCCFQKLAYFWNLICTHTSLQPPLYLQWPLFENKKVPLFNYFPLSNNLSQFCLFHLPSYASFVSKFWFQASIQRFYSMHAQKHQIQVEN